MENSNDVTINNGFWAKRQEINAQTTIYSIYDRFKETGRFDSLNLNRDDCHIFWDSDIAKWIEAASFIIKKNGDKKLISFCEQFIDIIEKGQEADGYFNIAFQTKEPNNRFTRRTDHELYCAGHLAEAAVAYYNATGKDKLLKIICRYIDLIEKRFKIEKSAKFTTPGHEEIELALIKLYRCTGEKRYFDLSKFFIDMRGLIEEDEYEFANHAYSQSHLPVRQQYTAEGHSVRACYLYTAMADIALEYKDDELKNACEKIFNNIINKKMYITGGIGSTYYGEAFSVDYDLPNDIAYSESCAAISLIFFAFRMLTLTGNSCYSDVIERILYNNFLSGISLDGRSFFYKNPLEINLKFKNRFPATKDLGHFPETQRLETFECSCCPPNISRVMASVGDYIYSEKKDILFVHQYITSRYKSITLESGFPTNGKVKVFGKGYKTVALRKPFWSSRFAINVNYTEKNGYLYIDVCDDFEISIDFKMETKLIESNINVTQNIGRVAIMHGPLVYCCEKICVSNIFIGDDFNPRVEFSNEYNTNIVKISAYEKITNNDLYSSKSENYNIVELNLIPYFGFANHGESDMTVWFHRK